MPDWSYQTVFRPLLFRMPPRKARGFALQFMGRLARLPLGAKIIQLMGHMAPDVRLRLEKAGLAFPSRVGLGAEFDPSMTAYSALAEFGFGYLEVGPVVAQTPSSPAAIKVNGSDETIQFSTPIDALTPIDAVERLPHVTGKKTTVIARLAPNSMDEARTMVDMLEPHVDAFAIEIGDRDRLGLSESSKPVLLIVRSLDDLDALTLEALRPDIKAGRCGGFIVAERAEPELRRLGADGRDAARELVRAVRELVGQEPLVIGAVGVHCPADAMDFYEAGADLVQLDSGLVFAGPGLPKRINEAVLYGQIAVEPEPPAEPPEVRIGGYSWFWALLMGLSMIGGGLLALLIATTRIVLPYDEAMTGLTRAELAAVNPKLLAFMAHDRVTLSGAMLAVGIQYSALSWWGIRQGVHWAYVAVIVSAFAGFCCFFSFLGFGYFDPFHAFVTAILFQFLLLTIHSRLTPRRELAPPDLWNERRWRLSLWGQLMFVIHGAVLIVAGSVITKVGLTSVFVPEDLEFMHTSADQLFGAHPQLVPLVAHDRATFGGMLISCGFTTLLSALWGFRRGQAWLWWSLVLAGSVAYLATILIHWSVGYTSPKHLLPAYGGLLWLWIGGLLSYSHLVGRNQELTDAWNQRIGIGPTEDSTTPS